MGILQIEPATLGGMRFLFSFYGLSESGKTLSALRVAAGLEPDPQKRMMLDAEGGGRGRAYVNEIAGGYLYAQLSPPYTPERYIQALDEIERAGVTVCVTDSISHSWFAEGGVLAMVEESTLRNDMAKWKEPKRRLGKMMQRYRSSDMHHILCSRAKQPLIEAEVNGRKQYVPGPIVPIQERMMRFDMTVIAQMLGRGEFTLEAPQGKCPGNLLPIFAASPLMNEETGRRLAEWVSVRNSLSPEVRALKTQAISIAESGTAPFREFWAGLDRSARDALRTEIGNYESIAKSADDERGRAAAGREAEDETDRERTDPALDHPFGGGPIEPAGDHQSSAAAQNGKDSHDSRGPVAEEPAEPQGSQLSAGTAKSANAPPKPEQADPAPSLSAVDRRIPMVTDLAGKANPPAWAIGLFLPQLAQQTADELPYFLGDNEAEIGACKAPGALPASDLRDFEGAIAAAWRKG